MKQLMNTKGMRRLKNTISILCVMFLIIFSSACNTEKRAVFPTDMSVGDIITFGSYEQDNVSSNGTEKLEWLVLDTSDNYALLISKYIITSHQFNLNENSVTWEDSTLRAWLNSTFFEDAFSLTEQGFLVSKDIQTESVHQMYFSSLLEEYILTVDPLPLCNTSDRVFVLSRDELAEYFPSENSRIAKPTTFVKMTSDDAFQWWTRTPGIVVGSQRIVDDKGSYELGGASNQIDMGVRPAILIQMGK